MKVDYNAWHKEVYLTNMLSSIKQNEKFYGLILEELGIYANSIQKLKILDVPTGKGTFLKFLQLKGLNLDFLGIDISKYAINIARSNVKGEFIEGNAEILPYKNNFFDYIVCLGGLEYYRHPAKAVREMSRVLKNNGKVLIYVPNLMFIGQIYFVWKDGRMPSEGGKGGKYYNYEAERFFTYQGWKDIIERNGLKIVKSSSYNKVGWNIKVSPLINILFFIIRNIIPFHLSYTFIFVCNKDT